MVKLLKLNFAHIEQTVTCTEQKLTKYYKILQKITKNYKKITNISELTHNARYRWINYG